MSRSSILPIRIYVNTFDYSASALIDKRQDGTIVVVISIPLGFGFRMRLVLDVTVLVEDLPECFESVESHRTVSNVMKIIKVVKH